MISPKKSTPTHLATAIMCCLASTTIQAQTNEPETKAKQSANDELFEIINVRAQKKGNAEPIQNVPVSITAFSGQQVEAMFAVNLTDVGLMTPNASLTEVPTFPGVANYVIRGMGTAGQSIPSADPSVGVVVDGVSLGTIYGVNTDLFDLESVEILRGPQGTLFGRNVTGGAVTLRTVRPTDIFEGKIRATVGNYGQRDAAVLLTGPLGENWAGKISVLRKDRDGYWDNRTLGGRQGASETLLVRPAVSYQGDNFDATLIFEDGRVEADGLGAITFWVDGEETVDLYDRRLTFQDEVGFSDLNWSQITLEANQELWGGTLTGVFGYRDLTQDTVADIDGIPGARFHFANGTGLEQDQTSLELRWSSQISDTIDLTTGVYLFSQEYTYAERRILSNAVDRRGVSTIEHTTRGIFAQADILLTDDITLTLGGRFTNEEKEAAIGVIGDPNAVGDCATQSPPLATDLEQALADCQPALLDDEDWSNFTPKLGVDWKTSENILLFASYSRGFRSGGYNVRFTDLSFVTNPDNPSSTPGPYDEETVDAFEVGLKSDLLDGTLRFNASIFRNQYDDLQRTSLNAAGGQEILNAASATIQGIELDTTYAATDNLVFQGNIGYSDAEYDSFESAEAATGLAASELRLVLVPEITYALSANYYIDIGAHTLKWRGAFSYVDDTVSDDFNRTENRSYQLVDTSLTFIHEDTGLQLALYAKNLFDEVYYDFGTNFSTSALAIQSRWLTPPRTYGLELTYDF